MTSVPLKNVLARVAVLTVLALAAAFSLIGLSGMIIFADIKAPQPAELASEAIASQAAPSVLTGGGR
jgi:hypothetical protein